MIPAIHSKKLCSPLFAEAAPATSRALFLRCPVVPRMFFVCPLQDVFDHGGLALLFWKGTSGFLACGGQPWARFGTCPALILLMEGAGGRDFAFRLETSSFDLLPLGSTRCTALLPSAFPSKRSSNERLPMASRKQTAIENNDTVNDFVWLVCSCYCGVSCCTLDCRLAAGSSQLRRCAQLAMSRSLWFLRLSPGDVHQRTPASAARSANEGGREHTCWHLTQSILYISVAQNARVWHLPW